MPRNRPTPSADRRLLAEATGAIAQALSVLTDDGRRAAVSASTGRPPAGPSGLSPAPRPLAEYCPVSELGPAHLGRWVTVLLGTYAADPDPSEQLRMREAATYGRVRGLQIEKATAGRLVGFQPSSKTAMEAVPYRVLVIQQGSVTSPVEVWGGRPVIISPRELS